MNRFTAILLIRTLARISHQALSRNDADGRVVGRAQGTGGISERYVEPTSTEHAQSAAPMRSDPALQQTACKKFGLTYGLISCALFWLMDFATATPLYFSPKTVTEIDLYASGKIRIESQANGPIRVDSSRCELSASLVGNRLLLSALGSSQMCRAITVRSSPNTPVSVHSDRSDFGIRGITAPISVRQRGGVVSISHSKDLTVRMAEGTIDATWLGGDTQVWLGRGAAHLQFERYKPKTQVFILTGEANTIVTLPNEARVFTRHKLKFGHYASEFSQSKDPDIIVSMTSETGNLTIQRKKPLLP